MKTTKTNTSFAYPHLGDQLQTRLRGQQNSINNALEVLKRYGEPTDLATLKEYRDKGTDWKRLAAMQQVDEYIEKTEMPALLQPDARKRAFDSVSEEFIEELTCAVDCAGEFDPTTLYFDEGWHEWRFTDECTQAETDKLRRVLTDTEESDLDRFIEALEIVESLEALGYNAKTAIAGGITSTRSRSAQAYALHMLRRKIQ